MSLMCWLIFFFFKQKTAYEMRISDWSSDVCSSDLRDWQPVGRERTLSRRRETRSGNNTWIAIGSRDGFGEILAEGLGDWSCKQSNRIRVASGHIERSEGRRVGKECVSKCRSRWSPYH